MPDVIDEMVNNYFTYDAKNKKLIITYGGTNLIQDGLNSSEEALQWLKEHYGWMIDKIKEDIDNYNRHFIEQHYPVQKQLGFMQASVQLQQQLANPNLTDTQKQVIQQKLFRISSVADWMQNKCTALYYQLEQQIDGATTIEELNNVAGTYQQQYAKLEDTDPKVTFKELLG